VSLLSEVCDVVNKDFQWIQSDTLILDDLIMAFQLLAYYCRGLGSIPGQSMQWIKCHWLTVFPVSINSPMPHIQRHYIIL